MLLCGVRQPAGSRPIDLICRWEQSCSNGEFRYDRVSWLIRERVTGDSSFAMLSYRIETPFVVREAGWLQEQG